MMPFTHKVKLRNLDLETSVKNTHVLNFLLCIFKLLLSNLTVWLLCFAPAAEKNLWVHIRQPFQGRKMKPILFALHGGIGGHVTQLVTTRCNSQVENEEMGTSQKFHKGTYQHHLSGKRKHNQLSNRKHLLALYLWFLTSFTDTSRHFKLFVYKKASIKTLTTIDLILCDWLFLVLNNNIHRYSNTTINRIPLCQVG
jgi:hypothetical protein